MATRKTQHCIGHLSLEVTNINETMRFFDALLTQLGFKRVITEENALCYSGPQIDIWFGKEPTQRVLRGTPNTGLDVIMEHVGLQVNHRSRVSAVANLMRSKGFKPLFEPAELDEDYFAASFLGPDNLVFEVFTRSSRG